MNSWAATPSVLRTQSSSVRSEVRFRGCKPTEKTNKTTEPRSGEMFSKNDVAPMGLEYLFNQLPWAYTHGYKHIATTWLFGSD